MVGGKHKQTCVFCYECFRFISLAYLNAFIKDKNASILWKCTCGDIISKEYLMCALGKQLGEAYNILNKNDKMSLFCVECGCPTKNTTKPKVSTGSIKCEKHDKWIG